MIWFALLIPICFTALGLLFFKHKFTWIEALSIPVASIILILLLKMWFVSGLTDDTEYLTEYPIEIRYYEHWDEYISQTCTSSVSCGKNCTTTVSYDCSYVDDHPRRWVMKMNTGTKHSISESYYNSLAKLWSTTRIFVDMHRDYDTYDGDMYKYKWGNKFKDIDPYVYEHGYENKVQTVNSIMQFRELDTLEIKGLYNYPKVTNYTQESCLGCTPKENLLLNRYNAYLGFKYEVKMFVLVYKDKQLDIGELQQIYWKGGNKNELVVCVDSKNQWSKAFSWVDDKLIEVKVADIFLKDISMEQKIKLMEHEVEDNWKRKHFSDFSYIHVPLTNTHKIIIYIVIFLASLGLFLYGIFNEFDPEDENRNINSRRW